jgi:hypothetical protein
MCARARMGPLTSTRSTRRFQIFASRRGNVFDSLAGRRKGKAQDQRNRWLSQAGTVVPRARLDLCYRDESRHRRGARVRPPSSADVALCVEIVADVNVFLRHVSEWSVRGMGVHSWSLRLRSSKEPPPWEREGLPYQLRLRWRSLVQQHRRLGRGQWNDHHPFLPLMRGHIDSLAERELTMLFANRIPTVVLGTWLIGCVSDQTAPDHSTKIETKALADYCEPSVDTFVGDFPSDRSNDWTWKVQGVAHDADHWIFMQQNRILKFPVGSDLRRQPGEIADATTMIPPHLQADYYHYGDGDEFAGFLFVPIEQIEGHDVAPRIVVFRSSDLSYVADAPVSDTRSGWVAINPNDWMLYTSHDTMDGDHPMVRYPIDWSALWYDGVLALGAPEPVTIKGDFGLPLVLAPFLQGGDFSDDGCLLYLVDGREVGADPSNGIHVIDTSTWSDIKQSSTMNLVTSFVYEFHSDIFRLQEPEGLTYWDLPDTFGIPASKLHVMLDGMLGHPSLWLKHYR